jgi:hypothetical protein
MYETPSPIFSPLPGLLSLGDDAHFDYILRTGKCISFSCILGAAADIFLLTLAVCCLVHFIFMAGRMSCSQIEWINYNGMYL